jgi:hypothetical protein
MNQRKPPSPPQEKKYYQETTKDREKLNDLLATAFHTIIHIPLVTPALFKAKTLHCTSFRSQQYLSILKFQS